MGKIALLVSREEMLYQAHNILQEKKFRIEEMRVIQTKDTVVEARSTIANGASIIIARGLQASLIKQYTNIPVVEIVLTAQEMALLVVKAKQILAKERPCIAVVGFENMFCDMSYFEDIYGIELRTYYSQQGNQLDQAAKCAVDEQADLIIGGDTAVEAASKAGIPSLFLSITEDSLRNAFSMAESMDYAMGVEKKNAAQMETLLDYSFDGVVNMDRNGVITGVNNLMQELIGKPEKSLTGILVTELFDDILEVDLDTVLIKGRERSVFVKVNQISMLAVLAPVLLDNQVDGIIMTCHKIKKEKHRHWEKQGDHNLGQLRVNGDFRDLIQESPAMQQCLRLAKLYALSDHPVVVTGEVGTEKVQIAQAIHNNSPGKNGSFVQITCDGLGEEAQMEKFFGKKGAAWQAHEGTLVIPNIEQINRGIQALLVQLIREKAVVNNAFSSKSYLNLRIIILTEEPIEELLLKQFIRADLYYLLSGMVLKVPPLRARRADLQRKIEQCIEKYCDYYGRYHVLTAGALKVLSESSWPGNLYQIESFCERLVLTANKRTIDEHMVKRLLLELYPVLGNQPEDSEAVTSVISEREKKIKYLLKKYDGNREKIARELGISKATLWRYMKKYNINE